MGQQLFKGCTASHFWNAANGTMCAQAHVMLPNGWHVPAYSEAEALFIYDEVVTQQCYLQDGIQISNGDVVIDVGANIGQCTIHWSEARIKLEIVLSA